MRLTFQLSRHPNQFGSTSAIYAPDEVVARSQALADVGDALPLYDAAWTEIQAA